MRVKEVILVEGKGDVERVKQAFPGEELDFLISHGLGFRENFLNLCKTINGSRGLIIFTDPDGPGNKIRERVNEFLDFKCKNAFVDKKKIIDHGKIGVAEAELSDIVEAIKGAITFDGSNFETISWQEYLNYEFNEKQNRVKIANYFSWSEKINAKTLHKWLNYTRTTVEDVEKILKGE